MQNEEWWKILEVLEILKNQTVHLQSTEALDN